MSKHRRTFRQNPLIEETEQIVRYQARKLGIRGFAEGWLTLEVQYSDPVTSVFLRTIKLTDEAKLYIDGHQEEILYIDSLSNKWKVRNHPQRKYKYSE